MSLPGLEAIHAWTPPGASAPVIELNRRKDDAYALPVFPQYRVQKLGGWGSLGEPSASNDPRVGRDGEIPRRGRRRGKTTTVEGDVIAKSRSEMRQAEADLRAAFADITREGRMDVSLHANNPDAPYSRFFNARAVALEIDDTLVSPTRSLSGGWERPFVLALRWSDARYFGDSTPAEFKRAIIALGPSLYWALDDEDGVTDLSGNGRDGTAHGGITIGGAAGLTAIDGDSATNFDGSDDYLTSIYNPFVDGSPRTYFLIVDQDGNGVNPLIIGNRSWGVTPGLWANFPTDEDLTWRMKSTVGGVTDPTGVPDPNTTYVVAAVVEETSDKAELFLNGESVAVATGLTDVQDAGPTPFLTVGGNAAGGGTGTFDGQMSHLAIFERALGADEIAAISEWATTGVGMFF